jgi:hypothetical protein
MEGGDFAVDVLHTDPLAYLRSRREDLGLPVDLVLDEDLKPTIGAHARAEAIPV